MLKAKRSIHERPQRQKVTPWTAAAFGGGHDSSPRVCFHPELRSRPGDRKVFPRALRGRARHSVRAAPATGGSKFSPAACFQPMFPRSNFGIRVIRGSAPSPPRIAASPSSTNQGKSSLGPHSVAAKNCKTPLFFVKAPALNVPHLHIPLSICTLHPET